jgi:long-chain acyl-CoA synthetase
MYKRLFDFAYDQLEHHPLDVMFRSKCDGEWETYSTQKFIDHVNQLSNGLIEYGIQPGQKIALITDSNRTEWNICDHAALQIGAVDVPIYPTMTERDIQYILNHSEATICFVSNQELLTKIKNIHEQVPALKDVFTFEKTEGAKHWKELLSFNEDSSKVVQSRKDNIKTEDLATIIYTSGTTGLPKGVMLSHSNIASNVELCEDRLPELEKGHARCVSFLPTCHIFERMLHYLYINRCVSITLTGMDNIKDDLIANKPHMFTAVPRLLEKFFDGIIAKGESNSGIKKSLFQWSVKLALQWEPERANGSWYEFKLKIAQKLVFSKVKAALGLTEIGAIACGSAALQPRLSRFFTAAGIPIKEGYGLTETSPVISVNTLRTPNMYRPGTVGTIIPRTEVKFAEDGEILVKGPQVMMGYYKNPETTAEVLNNGWFSTGDIGILKDGFLKITDRKKELFKTSGGKYVAPQVLENALKESHFIEQCMVVGDGQKFPGALIVVDCAFAKVHFPELANLSNEEIIQNEKLNQAIKSFVTNMNNGFGSWEQIKGIHLIAKPFTVESDEITPTLKLKRKKILENYADAITQMYA